jgi:hypothetical protein
MIPNLTYKDNRYRWKASQNKSKLELKCCQWGSKSHFNLSVNKVHLPHFNVAPKKKMGRTKNEVYVKWIELRKSLQKVQNLPPKIDRLFLFVTLNLHCT